MTYITYNFPFFYENIYIFFLHATIRIEESLLKASAWQTSNYLIEYYYNNSYLAAFCDIFYSYFWID